MTVRERVLASRIVQKIDNKDDFTKRIGLSYTMVTDGLCRNSSGYVQKIEKKDQF